MCMYVVEDVKDGGFISISYETAFSYENAWKLHLSLLTGDVFALPLLV